MHRFTLVLLLTALLAAPGLALRKARIHLRIEPVPGTITTSTRILVVPEKGADTIDLLLNRRLRVSRLSADIPIRGFSHRQSGSGPYRFAPQATRLRIELMRPASGKPVHLNIDAAGKVEPDDWGVIQVTPRWVELEAVYSGWFPFQPRKERFRVDLQVEVPPGWMVAGTGGPAFREGIWQSTAEDVHDVVVLAAPDLQRIPVGDTLTLWHVNLPGGAPLRIARDTEQLREILFQWFRVRPGSHVDLVFAPRKDGGGFARPGLVVMLYDNRFYDGEEPTPVFLRYLAHEISHLWWRQAPASSWQDWLNESFAEFTALMVLRQRFGASLFQERVEKYRRESADTPPIRNLPRHHEQAFKVLYRKGPVLLADLEKKIGRKAFLGFLRALVREKVTSTDTCLDVLKRTVSPAARDHLAESLNR